MMAPFNGHPGPPSGGPGGRAGEPFALAGLDLRNRIVGTPHARGYVEDGLPLPADADYWRRLAAGGAAMLTIGGTVTAPESTYRRGNLTEAWRPEAQPGLALRAEAIRAEGAVAACQLVHLGRETLGAETWFHHVAPSAVRSPREPTRPRPMTDGEVDAVVEGFRASAVNVVEAGFEVVELHAAHGYLLGQFLSPRTNHRPDAGSGEERFAVVARIAEAIRAAAPGAVLGIRLSAGGGGEGGLTLDELCELLPRASALFDYVNVTVGVRTTYVRDMATETPPLLGEVARLRTVVTGPLAVSQAFRRSDVIEEALSAGADLVGVARALIADPDFPRKVLGGREAEVRPCVACNEDCRAFDPVLLCSVNPDLAPAGTSRRPAAPLLVRRGDGQRGGRVAIVGAGPGGLECAWTLARAGDREVVVFDERDAIGGQLAVAAAAPQRTGWRALLEFYGAALASEPNVELRLATHTDLDALDGFDEVVLAVGSEEVLPAIPGVETALTSSAALSAGAGALAGSRLLVVDDGFGWWPCASAVELGVQAGCASIDVVTPSAGFGATLPAEPRVQLLQRLRATPVRIHAMTALSALRPGAAELRSGLAGAPTVLEVDTAILVGERCARDWSALVTPACGVRVIGDALVPRRAAHAIAEGRAAGDDIARAGSSGALQRQAEELEAADRQGMSTARPSTRPASRSARARPASSRP